jgi:hypothetical protein
MEEIFPLLHLTVLFLLGLLLLFAAHRFRVRYELMMIAAGLFLGSLAYDGTPLIALPPVLQVGLVHMLLILSVLEVTRHLRSFDSNSAKGFQLGAIVSVGVVFLIPATLAISGYLDIPEALLVAIVLLASRSDAPRINKPQDLIHFASILCALVSLFLFSLLSSGDFLVGGIGLMIGLATGSFIGLFASYIASRSRSGFPYMLIVAGASSYVFSVLAGGSGAAAAAATGFFIANVKVKDRKIMDATFTRIFESFSAVALLLLGIILHPTLTMSFALAAVGAVCLLFVIRAIASYSVGQKGKELLFCSLYHPVGALGAALLMTIPSAASNGIVLFVMLITLSVVSIIERPEMA